MTNLVPATNEDKDFLAQVCESVVPLYHPIMPGVFEKQAGRFRVKGLSNRYKTYIVNYNDNKIGFLGVKDITKEISYLVALYFHSNYQRQGIGGKTMSRLYDRLRCKGFKEIVLLVHKEAYWAVNFYKKEDFEIVGETKNEMLDYLPQMEKEILPSTYLMTKIISK